MCQRTVLFTFTAILLASMVVSLFAVQNPGSTPVKKDTRPAEIQEIQEVKTVEAKSPPTLIDLIGRLHPAVVHFPIAWVVLLFFVEVVAFAFRRDELSSVGLPLLVVALSSMLPAIFTGFLLASSLQGETEIHELMVLHRNLNIAASATCLFALVWRCTQGTSFAGGKKVIYLSVLAGATAMFLVAGHLGGKMVFGKDYFPF